MNKINLTAVCILCIMLFLMVASAWNDSAIVDELAHIPAGFGYITRLDYRLNPEHPPIIKALAAFSSWLVVRPYFPTTTSYWHSDTNGQWAQGATFLYESGNDADRVIFWSRMPVMLLAILFGALIFWWTKKRFGLLSAFFALIFFAFSPTVLAHSRYVTTDLGAAFGFFIGISAFIKFLETPSWRTALLAGLACGVAQLFKFSLVLLIPIYVLLYAAWIATYPYPRFIDRLKHGFTVSGKIVVAGLVALFCIWAVYSVFTFNYPQERQLRDATFLLSSYGFRPAANFDLALIKNPLTRPLGQYLLGVLMVQQRSAGGNTAYFLGHISAAGSRWYFPLLYLVKEPLALHILTLLLLWLGLKNTLSRKNMGRRSLSEWIQNHFFEFSAFVFIIFYWAVSIKSPLNIGVRHILPTFPFIFMLVGKYSADLLRRASISQSSIFILTLLWFIASSVGSFPHFLGYYNEAGGGLGRGYKIAVDSNYDWGQDLKRLTDFIYKNNIEKIALDYFGGGSPRYYLGDQFEQWSSVQGPAHGWFAVSATIRQGAFGAPAPGFIRKPEDSYAWLQKYEPIARIGSIFVYHFP